MLPVADSHRCILGYLFDSHQCTVLTLNCNCHLVVVGEVLCRHYGIGYTFNRALLRCVRASAFFLYNMRSRNVYGKYYKLVNYACSFVRIVPAVVCLVKAYPYVIRSCIDRGNGKIAVLDFVGHIQLNVIRFTAYDNRTRRVYDIEEVPIEVESGVLPVGVAAYTDVLRTEIRVVGETRRSRKQAVRVVPCGYRFKIFLIVVIRLHFKLGQTYWSYLESKYLCVVRFFTVVPTVVRRRGKHDIIRTRACSLKRYVVADPASCKNFVIGNKYRTLRTDPKLERVAMRIEVNRLLGSCINCPFFAVVNHIRHSNGLGFDYKPYGNRSVVKVFLYGNTVRPDVVVFTYEIYGVSTCGTRGKDNLVIVPTPLVHFKRHPRYTRLICVGEGKRFKPFRSVIFGFAVERYRLCFYSVYNLYVSIHKHRRGYRLLVDYKLINSRLGIFGVVAFEDVPVFCRKLYVVSTGIYYRKP